MEYLSRIIHAMCAAAQTGDWRQAIFLLRAIERFASASNLLGEELLALPTQQINRMAAYEHGEKEG